MLLIRPYLRFKQCLTILEKVYFCYQQLQKQASTDVLKKKKNGLRSFAKYTVKHLCQSLCFNKVDSGTGVFLLIFVKLLRTPFLIEHLWCVLLHLKSFHCTVIILCALEFSIDVQLNPVQTINIQKLSRGVL